MAPIGIATDCSGMEAPIQAIRNLGVKYSHVFSCDIDPHARATIAANFPHGLMYEDLTKRDNRAAPSCDVYIAGFPCQPFSTAGQCQGFKDTRGRGLIFFDVRDYIDKQRPKVFVLENVRGLKSLHGGKYFESIMDSLRRLRGYNLSYDLMDTRKHGIPHRRERFYIVGIRSDVDSGTFRFPEPIQQAPLKKFLERRPSREDAERGLPPVTQTVARLNVVNTKRELRRQGSDPAEEDVVIDCDSSPHFYKWMVGVSPCITVGRRCGHWVTSRGRRFYMTEMMRLQGMDPTKFKVVVRERELGKQLGNTMSVNVLERLFVKLLPAAGLVRGPLKDRWADGSAMNALAKTRCLPFARRFGKEQAAAGRTGVKRRRSTPSPSLVGSSPVKRARVAA